MDPTLIYIGARRHITAIDPETGTVVWEHKLPGVFGAYLTLFVEHGVLYAARQGVLYALDARTGDLFWQAEITGAKHTPMMIASSTAAASMQEQHLLAKQFRAAQAAAAT